MRNLEHDKLKLRRHSDRLPRRLLRAVRRSVRRPVGAVMDRWAGIDTAREVRSVDLGLFSPDSHDYEASGRRTLKRVLSKGEMGPVDVFVDFGSGKGRVLLEAARYPFSRIIGVEFSEQLCAIARANVEATKDSLTCREVEIVCADVLDYEVPDDVTVAFFYNPFKGETFAAVVDKLVTSLDRNPRRLRIIYRTPFEHEYIISTGRFHVIRSASSPRPTKKWRDSSSVRLYESLAFYSGT